MSSSTISGLNRQRLVTFELQKHAERIGRIDVVIDYQYSTGHHVQRRMWIDGGVRALNQRQSNLECGAAAQPFTARLRLSAVHFYEALDNRKTDAQSSLGSIERAFALNE
jgi:hypothetical protein